MAPHPLGPEPRFSRWHSLMAAAIVRVCSVFMIALVVIMAAIVVMLMSGPRWKGVGKMLPTFGAACHFVGSQETRIKLLTDHTGFHVDRHQSDGLAAVAEGLLPFVSRAQRHLLVARFRVSRRPPLTRRSALQLRSGKVKAADEISP